MKVCLPLWWVGELMTMSSCRADCDIMAIIEDRPIVLPINFHQERLSSYTLGGYFGHIQDLTVVITTYLVGNPSIYYRLTGA